MYSKTKEEQLEIAKNSSCSKELRILKDSRFMNVRRAVARNLSISKNTANYLATDPVLNVSYMALQNPNSTIKRTLCKDSITFCVSCEKDERYLDCIGCEYKEETSLLNF